MNCNLKKISLDKIGEFAPKIFELFNKQWFLLSSGSVKEGHVNGMTVSWGLMGTIWNKPIVMAMSRPQRYTTKFLNQYKEFSLCAFPEAHRQALTFCGTKSGRDFEDKFAAAGLTVCAVEGGDLPVLEEANLILTCRVISQQELEGASLPTEIVQSFYPGNDWHTLYFGEVTAIYADDSYLNN